MSSLKLMATIHVPAEKDDISYSHTLKKLLRVNVEKGPDAARNIARNMGQTGISHSSVLSRYDLSADPMTTQQSRSRNGSPGGSPGPTGHPRDKAGLSPMAPIVPGMSTGTTSKASRRATYHPPPEPPASFMRSAYSAPAPRRRQRRSTSGSTGSNGNGNRPGGGNGTNSSNGASGNGSGSGALCKEKSGTSTVATRTPVVTASQGAVPPPIRRVASLSSGVLAAAIAADSSAAQVSTVGGSAVSVSWNPHLLSPRPRVHIHGVSNLSYKPPSNVTAEPAAAVLQRRRAAFAASRGVMVSPVGGAGSPSCAGAGANSVSNPFLFGGTASGGGGSASETLIRASWASPSGHTSPSPMAIHLLTIGLGPSIDVDGAGKAGDSGVDVSGVGGVGGGGGHLGFGAFGEEGVGGVGSDAYDNIWPLAGWRGLSTTADGDADAVRTAADGSTAEPGGLPYYMLPTTAPVMGSVLRRGTVVGAGGAAPVPDSGGGGGGGGSGGATAATFIKPSIFAPPQQLYMKGGDEPDDGPGGPIATVATAAAKAGRTPPPPSPSPTPSSMTDRPSLRIPSLDLGLLRPTLSPIPGAVAAAPNNDGSLRDGSGGGGGVSPVHPGPRPLTLIRYDSDLGQNCHGDGVDGEEPGGGCTATTALAAAGTAAAATRTTGELLKPNVRQSALQSSPATPMGGATSVFKTGQVITGTAAGDGGGAEGNLTEAQLRAKRRTSARGALPSLDGEPSTGGTSGPYMMGDTTKMLQVGISVAALIEVVKTLGQSQRFATTAEIFEHWLMPATRASQCRFLDLVMARVKIILGDPPETSHAPPTPGARGSYNGLPILHPDRTWFGPPDYYVIHSWSGNFAALVSALREYCAIINKTPSSTYVWLDLVAANHHPGRKDKKELSHCKQIMATARKALLVLDPMSNSLTRLWCLYEIWLAACAAPGASPTKLALLNAGTDWDAFADSFFRIDLSRCMTSNPEDRPKLLEDMIRTSHDAGSYGSSSQHASGTTISPYGVVAALPQLSAAVRGALFDAAAGDVTEARRGARGGGNGVLVLLDAVERYAMIRRLAGGHVEAEEQLEAAVAVAMGVSGTRNSVRPSSPPAKSTLSGGGGISASADGTAAGPGAAAAAAAAKGDTAAPQTATRMSDTGGDGAPPQTPIVTLPPIFPSSQASTTAAPSSGGGGGGGAATASTNTSSSNASINIGPASHTHRPLSPAVTSDEDAVMATATAAAAAAAAAAATAAAASAMSSSAAWRKKPATLAALAVLQAEHGRLIQASTHAAMALSCVPGLTLIRPVAPVDKDADSDEPYDHGGGGGGSRHARHQMSHQMSHGGSGSRQRSISPPGLHTLPSTRSRVNAYDAAGGGDHEKRSHGGHGRGGGGGGGGSGGTPSGSAPAPGEIAWKGSYWELTSPQNVPADAVRAIFMASIVEAACGRHEAAAQLALQAGLARAAALGTAHPATIATKRAVVPYLIQLGRLPEAQLLAKSLLREAVAEHGELHPSVGICHGVVAMVLAAQDKAELAYSSAQRGAEVLASALGRGHPATLDALQLCADMLESAREYGKAVALMRLVVKGRSAPGAIRASPACPAFLAPNNRLLHLRTIAALEEKAMSEEQSRRAMISVMRNLARLESELRAALMAMTGAAAQTQMQIQRDLELVLMAQNKRYEAAMLRKGELRPA